MRNPLRIIIAYARLLAFFAHSAVWLSLVAIAAVRHPGTFAYYPAAGVWIRGILYIFGVRLVVEGLENLDPEGRYVILANHRSQLDPPSIGVALFPRVTRWVSKKELRNVPILGRTLVLTGQIFIDRSDPASAVEELRRHRDDAGVLICFFPEGHRSSTRQMLPFKKGGAAFAISSGLAVVPVALSGSEKCLPNRSLVSTPGRIRIAFGKPIDTGGLTQADAGALTERVRGEIEALLAAMEGPDSTSKAA
ncbi:MAG: 1-acyl-sn-glycerol-3-phosphate acyltransferase [Deltaproteobacteria bacterium]|nr:1-acyl-sn-glycerol-3-phosphate acyltransferase [Deltaproteobacteria bacterium]